MAHLSLDLAIQVQTPKGEKIFMVFFLFCQIRAYVKMSRAYYLAFFLAVEFQSNRLQRLSQNLVLRHVNQGFSTWGSCRVLQKFHWLCEKFQEYTNYSIGICNF